MGDLKDDIGKYLEGKLTPSERHALEKKALSDPFLADALEGASTLTAEDFAGDLSSLHQTLKLKTGENHSSGRSIWFWPLRIAAGVALLAVSAYLVNNLIKDSSEEVQNLALNKEEQADPATPAPKETLPESPAAVNEIQNDTETTIESEPVKPSVPKEKRTIEISEEQHMALREDESPSDTEAREVIISSDAIAGKVAGLVVEPAPGVENNFSLMDSTLASPTFASEMSRAKQAAPTAGFVAPVKRVHGKVTDQDDDIPIPGVNVVVKGTDVGAVTDLNGNFELNAPITGTELVFSYIGMETKEVPITGDQLTLQMTPDVSQLSEVVVIGYDGEEETYEGVTWELAEPAGGRREYKKYLEQSLTYPKLALDNQVEGKVTIQFTIQPTGQLSDFRVVRSIGYGCDEEVIRLIAEGPKWKPTKRNDEPVRGKAKVKVRFTLPQKGKK